MSGGQCGMQKKIVHFLRKIPPLLLAFLFRTSQSGWFRVTAFIPRGILLIRDSAALKDKVVLRPVWKICTGCAIQAPVVVSVVLFCKQSPCAFLFV